MKKVKKIASLTLAILMVLAMALPCMTVKAAEDKQITIKPSATVPITEKSEFSAYKILDAKAVGGEEVVYTVPNDMKSFYCKRYKLRGDEKDFAYQVAQNINAEKKKDMYAFADAVLAAAKSAGITGITGTFNAGNYVISGLDVGYYAISDNEGAPVSQVILDTTTDNLEVTLKADQPPIDKKIDGEADTDEETEGEVEENNAAVGDVVPYIVKTTVPSMAGYTSYKFVMSDTMSEGLTLQDDNDTGFEIKVGSQELVRGTDYKIEKNGNSFKIVFVKFYEKYKEMPGAEIVVKYSAVLNDNAVLGTDANTNDVQLSYSNHPSHVGGGDDFGDGDRKGETAKVTVYTYVTGLQLLKVNANNENLAGAEFTLSGTRINRVDISGKEYVQDNNGLYYKLTEDGTYTTQAPNGDNDNRYEMGESGYVKYDLVDRTGYQETKEDVTATAVTGDDGLLVFKGLAAGTYTITEIKAPDGYNMLNGPITVVIGCTYNDEHKATWTGTSTLDGKDTTLTFSGETGIIEGLNVVNNTGTELPSTGGIGTTIFYIVGAILVIGAGIILVTKKRMSRE